jgi:prepilin-type N-terminal cleavage/methylation domain-containing protein
MIMTSIRRLPDRRRTGFTMVEMLTVIGIIVILMAILLPTVSKVRQMVRVAATQQEMSKISGAIQQYYLEFNHAYPGPFSNVQISNGLTTPSAITITNINGGPSVIPTSTENMVLGVCGGLEIPPGTTGTISALNYNSNDIQSSLGPLNLNPNIAKQTRHIAFIDGTPGQQMPDQPWDGANGMQGTSDSFIPEFMDKFNSYNGGLARPILYLRAQMGMPSNAGNTGTAQICSGNDTTTQYNYMHLQPYATANDFYGFTPAIGGSGGANDATQGGQNSAVAPYVVKGTNASTTWDTYLGNPNQFTSPRGMNAYILISAGADGVFGTQDDIFNP